jgi:tripartite-type tricarboxylate transporter receptor subunit TctC
MATNRRAVAALVLAVVAGHAVPCAAQSYPDRAIRLLVGYGPGSGVDLVGRLYAQSASGILNEPVVVENRPGASSNVAAAYVAHAKKDGYTLFMATSTNVTNSIAPTPGFDFATDFTPVMLTSRMPFFLVASPTLGVNTVKELIALAKSKPGAIFFGSTGTGGTAHLAGELFNMKAGVKMVHVPYQGSGPAMTDLVAGRINVMFSPALIVAPLIKTGKLKALAVAAATRSAIAPDVPTMAEAGMSDFETSVWDGLMAPVGTSPAVIDKLSAAFQQAAKDPQIVATLSKQGAEVGGGTPKQFADFIAVETRKWMAVATAAGLRQ